MSGSGDGAQAQRRAVRRGCFALLVLATVIVTGFLLASRSRAQSRGSTAQFAQARANQTLIAKASGCVSCHVKTDEPSMHPTGTVRLGCVDCHGGDATVILSPGHRRRNP